ncbi:hypothetical protein BHM03_00041396 [Ensete ventricosum]|uniref:Uncharacterized protein n=1 Tax=Ensete ventricosum TaxID=4639 RepID=A0A445MKA4_ENSVE|nr:hypothetical protein BHM03_00041396 [Ensete ventricosum]
MGVTARSRFPDMACASISTRHVSTLDSSPVAALFGLIQTFSGWTREISAKSPPTSPGTPEDIPILYRRRF